MLTTNIDINDRLINEQMGTVTKIVINHNTKPSTIYSKFDDSQAGIKTKENVQRDILEMVLYQFNLF